MPDQSSNVEKQQVAESAVNIHSFGYGRPENMSLVRELVFVLVITCAQLFTQIGVGQGIAPIEIIGDYFGDTDPGVKAWYVAGYALTVGTFILAAGRLGDMFGHKLMFVIGFAWFCVWSLLAGIANYVQHSSVFFSFCRGMQGIGPAVLLPNGLAILGRTYHSPGRRKHLVFAFFGASAPSGFLIGCLFSGMLAQLSFWAWGFYIMAICCAGLAVLSIFVIPPDDSAGFSEVRNNEGFDYLGAFFGIAGLILINCAWNQSPIEGWERAYVYVLLIVGTACLVAFFIVELKVAKHPLIPLAAFNGTIGRTLTCIACGWATFGIWIFFLWQFWLNLQHKTPLTCSAQFVPAAISGFAASLFTGLVVGRMPTSLVMMIAMIAFCAAVILLAPMPIHQTYWAESFVSIIVGCWGMDISFPAATILLSSAVPKEHQGIAASLVATVVNYSISIGLGIAGTVQRYTVPQASVVVDNIQIQLKSYRSAFYTAIGLSGLGVLVAFYSVIVDLISRKKKTNL